MSSKIMKVAIGNRISTIHEETAIQDWKFVPTDLNFAVLVSRGCAAQTLLEHTMWRSGPPYLKEKENFLKLPYLSVTEDMKEGIRKGKLPLPAHSFFLTNEKRHTKSVSYTHLTLPTIYSV